MSKNLNIYSLHSNPEELYGYKQYIDNKVQDLIRRILPERYKAIHTAGEFAYEEEARDIIEVMTQRNPEVEKKLLRKDAYASLLLVSYVKNVIGGKWEEAEEEIFKDDEAAVDYAINVTHERLPKELEERILDGWGNDVAMYNEYFHLNGH